MHDRLKPSLENAMCTTGGILCSNLYLMHFLYTSKKGLAQNFEKNSILETGTVM